MCGDNAQEILGVAMRIEGPERYQLTIDRDALRVLCAKGTNKFSGLATKTVRCEHR